MNNNKLSISRFFAFSETQTPGASIAERFDSYQDFKEVKEMHHLCLIYANSYSEIMMKRL